MQRKPFFKFDEPSPRLQYEGNTHPVLKKVVVRQDAAGYRAARRIISRETPGHPCLRNTALWPDLNGKA